MYLPPNMTSVHQPSDMGVISAMKIGYKLKMLKILLNIFDQDGGYEAAAEQRLRQRRGCRGIYFGGKATIADAMKILNEIWIVAPHGNDVKYTKQDSIQHCWLKADILPFNDRPSAWNNINQHCNANFVQ